MGKRRKKKKNKGKEKERTGISKHQRSGKTLNPPFLHKLPGMSFSSWKDDRLPEMLWAALILGKEDRDSALSYFRYVLQYAVDDGIENVTLTGMSLLEAARQENFIKHICGYSEKTRLALRPLLLFDKLPGRSVWQKHLPSALPEEDWNALAYSIATVFDHQSQEATDCRWVRLMALILAGKLKLPSEEHVKKLLEYPNRGDLRFVRPFIRAAEISFPIQNKTWPNSFWAQGLSDTVCIPFEEEEVPKDKFSLSINQLDYIRGLLVNYFVHTDEKTAIDPKHDAIFGVVLFSMTLLQEQVATNLSRGSLGRLVLRNIAEAYIILAYLIKKDDEQLWKKFRDHGIGQMKLSSLKQEGKENPPQYFDKDKMKRFANEDRWEEFASIELGNWDSKDLRKMSEEAGCKNIYDDFYVWPSSYSHSGWGAIRESVMTACSNPMHRFHLLPRKHPSPMKSTLSDAVALVNKQLDLLQSECSEFDLRITDEKQLGVLALVMTLKEIIKKKQN